MFPIVAADKQGYIVFSSDANPSHLNRSVRCVGYDFIPDFIFYKYSDATSFSISAGFSKKSVTRYVKISIRLEQCFSKKTYFWFFGMKMLNEATSFPFHPPNVCVEYFPFFRMIIVVAIVAAVVIAVAIAVATVVAISVAITIAVAIDVVVVVAVIVVISAAVVAIAAVVVVAIS